ncbi:MAG: hypothetical protein ACR2RA_15075 [Geminicoccaceae bacterium]
MLHAVHLAERSAVFIGFQLNESRLLQQMSGGDGLGDLTILVDLRLPEAEAEPGGSSTQRIGLAGAIGRDQVRDGQSKVIIVVAIDVDAIIALSLCLILILNLGLVLRLRLTLYLPLVDDLRPAAMAWRHLQLSGLSARDLSRSNEKC